MNWIDSFQDSCKCGIELAELGSQLLPRLSGPTVRYLLEEFPACVWIALSGI